jgi:hypothetical protein
MVGSQITNLTLGPSFGHNFFLSVQMGHASALQTPTFQQLSNDIRNISIQWILGVHWDSNSQSGSSLGSVKVHSLTFFHIPGLPSWLAPLPTFTLVTSPRLGLRQDVFLQGHQSMHLFYSELEVRNWGIVEFECPTFKLQKPKLVKLERMRRENGKSN